MIPARARTLPWPVWTTLRGRIGWDEVLWRLPESLVPDDAGLWFAFMEHRLEHSPAL